MRKPNKPRSRWAPIIALALCEGWIVAKCDADHLVLRKPGWSDIHRGMPGGSARTSRRVRT